MRSMLKMSSANKNQSPTQYKFEVGDQVRIPRSTPGHDGHDPKTVFTITKRYPGVLPSYELKGSPSIWPETRLVLATRSLFRR